MFIRLRQVSDKLRVVLNTDHIISITETADKTSKVFTTSNNVVEVVETERAIRGILAGDHAAE